MSTEHASKSIDPKTTKQSSTSQPAFDALEQTEQLFEQAAADPLQLSPQAILQLQRTVGNQAVSGLLSRQAVTPAGDTLVQRWPPFGRGNGYQQLPQEEPDDSGSEAEVEQENPAYSKLKELGDAMATYYAIHSNYKKYKEYLGSQVWNLFDKAWGYVNKVIGWISSLDPSGITEAVAAVSKAVRLIVGYITEAVRLADETLVEELTPLLPRSLSLGTVKDAVKEAFDFGKTIKSAWDAVEAVL